MTKITLFRVSFTFAFLLFFVNNSNAQSCPGSPGCLDPTFGTDGKTLVETGPYLSNTTNRLRLQPDGKLLAMNRGTSYGHWLVRLNPDGTPDESFGVNGYRSFVWSCGNANDMAIQTVGNSDRILVVGVCSMSSGKKTLYNRLRIDRLMPDGTLDPTWGSGGVLQIDANSAYAIAVQPDQKILLVSSTHSSLMRLNPNGTVDSSFGSGGIVSAGNAKDVAVDPTGRIVVASTYSTGKGKNVVTYLAARRFTSHGILDTSFGSNGLALGSETPLNVLSFTLDSFGNLLFGSRYNGVSTDLLAQRLSADGGADNTFSEDSIVIGDYAGYNDGRAVVTAQSDGKVLVAGEINATSASGSGDLGVFRFNYDGSPDWTFGNQGKVGHDIGGSDFFGAIIMQTDPECGCEKIVVGGGGPGGNIRFASFARLLAFPPLSQ